jgi:hypothetical protein
MRLQEGRTDDQYTRHNFPHDLGGILLFLFCFDFYITYSVDHEYIPGEEDIWIGVLKRGLLDTSIPKF